MQFLRGLASTCRGMRSSWRCWGSISFFISLLRSFTVVPMSLLPLPRQRTRKVQPLSVRPNPESRDADAAGRVDPRPRPLSRADPARQGRARAPFSGSLRFLGRPPELGLLESSRAPDLVCVEGPFARSPRPEGRGWIAARFVGCWSFQAPDRGNARLSGKLGKDMIAGMPEDDPTPKRLREARDGPSLLALNPAFPDRITAFLREPPLGGVVIGSSIGGWPRSAPAARSRTKNISNTCT